MKSKNQSRSKQKQSGYGIIQEVVTKQKVLLNLIETKVQTFHENRKDGCQSSVCPLDFQMFFLA
jgi:hypothetical protein